MPQPPASLLLKYSKSAIAAIATLACLGTSAHAAIIRESERFERKRVNVGEEVTRTVDCPAGGSVTGEGYSLYNLPSDRTLFMVTASYPLNEGWRVEIRNITDDTHPLTFRVYALCQTSE